MYFPRIHDASPKTSRPAPRRRQPRQFVFNIEQLEVRTPLSAGLGTILAVHDAAFAPAPDRGVNMIAQGPSLGPLGEGPAPTGPAAPVYVQGDAPAGLPVSGPVGFVTSLVGRGELQSEGVWPATGPSASDYPGWPGASVTRDIILASSTYSAGSSFRATPPWPGASTLPDASSAFFAHSNGDGNSSVADTGMPGPLDGPLGVLTLEAVVSLGAGPMSPGGPAHAPTPGGDIDFTQQGEVLSPFLEMESSAPAPGTFGPTGGIFAPPIARGLVARLEMNANDAETTFAAPSSSTQTSAISPLQMMAMGVAGGRAASGTSLQSGGGLSAQVSSANEPIGGGWMSSIAAGDWGSGGMQPPSFSLADSTTTAAVAEPSSPAAITADGAPLSVLVTGPELPTQTTSDDLQQVAELIPRDQSSLALVASLWTVPSEIPTGAEWFQRLDASPAWLEAAAMTPSCTAYMIGLDQAILQSYRGLEQVVSPAQVPLIPNERDRLELDRQLEWERPIIPVGTGWVSDRRETSPRDTASALANDAIDALATGRLQTAGCLESSVASVASDVAPARSEPASLVKAGTLPLLGALSASTAITGWLWTRRNRKRRVALPGLAGRSG